MVSPSTKAQGRTTLCPHYIYAILLATSQGKESRFINHASVEGNSHVKPKKASYLSLDLTILHDIICVYIMFPITLKRQVYHKLIALVTASFFFLNVFTTDVLALAPQSSAQNAYTRCEFQIACLIRSGQLAFAEKPEDIRFLEERNHAKALLLSHGKILAQKDLKNKPEELLRAIIHEQIEAIIQIMAKEERSKYSTLINMVLGVKVGLPDKYLTNEERHNGKNRIDLRDAFVRLFPEESISRITNEILNDELLANHIIAKAFELIIARNDNLLAVGMSDEESIFLSAIEPIINANKHNYFTGVFWETNVRESKIRIAMANGMSFTQVATTASAEINRRESLRRKIVSTPAKQNITRAPSKLSSLKLPNSKNTSEMDIGLHIRKWLKKYGFIGVIYDRKTRKTNRVTVRAYRPSDAEKLGKYLSQFDKDFGRDFLAKAEDSMKCLHPDLLALVAETDNGAIIGAAAFSIVSGDEKVIVNKYGSIHRQYPPGELPLFYLYLLVTDHQEYVGEGWNLQTRLKGTGSLLCAAMAQIGTMIVRRQDDNSILFYGESGIPNVTPFNAIEHLELYDPDYFYHKTGWTFEFETGSAPYNFERYKLFDKRDGVGSRVWGTHKMFWTAGNVVRYLKRAKLEYRFHAIDLVSRNDLTKRTTKDGQRKTFALRHTTGTPAQLLREMSTADIFAVDAAKTSIELAGNAIRQGEADSRRTIQRELAVLVELGIVHKSGTRYYLDPAFKGVDIEQFIKDNEPLTRASLTPDELVAIKRNVARLRAVEMTGQTPDPSTHPARSGQSRAMAGDIEKLRALVGALDSVPLPEEGHLLWHLIRGDIVAMMLSLDEARRSLDPEPHIQRFEKRWESFKFQLDVLLLPDDAGRRVKAGEIISQYKSFANARAAKKTGEWAIAAKILAGLTISESTRAVLEAWRHIVDSRPDRAMVDEEAQRELEQGDGHFGLVEYFIENYLGMKKGEHVLEVGFSTAFNRIGLVVAKRGGLYLGFEMNPQYVDMTRQFWNEFDIGRIPEHGSMEAAHGLFSSRSVDSERIPTDSQDYVLMITGALSDPSPQSPSYEDNLREALRVLKNGGKLVVGSEGVYSEFERAKEVMAAVLESEDFKGRVELTPVTEGRGSGVFEFDRMKVFGTFKVTFKEKDRIPFVKQRAQGFSLGRDIQSSGADKAMSMSDSRRLSESQFLREKEDYIALFDEVLKTAQSGNDPYGILSSPFRLTHTLGESPAGFRRRQKALSKASEILTPGGSARPLARVTIHNTVRSRAHNILENSEGMIHPGQDGVLGLLVYDFANPHSIENGLSTVAAQVVGFEVPGFAGSVDLGDLVAMVCDPDDKSIRMNMLFEDEHQKYIGFKWSYKIAEPVRARLAIDLSVDYQALDKLVMEYAVKHYGDADFARMERRLKQIALLYFWLGRLTDELKAHDSRVPSAGRATADTGKIAENPEAISHSDTVSGIETALPKDALQEWRDFINALKTLGKTASEEPIKRALELDKKAAEYKKEGQSIILYADDILENVTVYDLQHTIKNILAKHNSLAGGKIILFARKAVTAKILEDMIHWASPEIKIETVLEADLQTNGDEVKEVDAVVRYARAKNAKDVLAIIRGPAKDRDNYTPFREFAKKSKIPLVIVGPDKALYSLAQALSMAMDAKLSDGARTAWLIMLPSIRTFTEDIRELHEQYKRALEALRAA